MGKGKIDHTVIYAPTPFAPASDLTSRTTFQKSVAIVKPDINKVHPLWLYYALKSNIDRLINFAGGTAQKNLLLRDMRAFEIDVPAFTAQQRIASILSAYDDLIENNTRRIAILEEMARRIYEEWFVKFRFPGHENVRLVESELGLIPEDWSVKTLSYFGKVITGKTPSKARPDFFGDDIPFIKTPDMHGNIFCISTNESLSILGAESQSNKYLPANTLCVSCIGTAGIVSITSMLSQTNQQINSIILNEQRNREFLYYALVGLKDTINLYGANGATMVNLNKGKFENLMLAYPEDDLIRSFSSHTKNMFELIKRLIIKNKNLRAQRDLLLPKLISGEIDVSNWPEPA